MPRSGSRNGRRLAAKLSTHAPAQLPARLLRDSNKVRRRILDRQQLTRYTQNERGRRKRPKLPHPATGSTMVPESSQNLLHNNSSIHVGGCSSKQSPIINVATSHFSRLSLRLKGSGSGSQDTIFYPTGTVSELSAWCSCAFSRCNESRLASSAMPGWRNMER